MRGASPGLVPLDGRAIKLAVAVALDDVGDHHRRQGAGASEDLASAHDGAVRFKVLEQRLQLALVVALDAEGARDLAFGDPGRRMAGRGAAASDESKEVFARRQRACDGRRLRARRNARGGFGRSLDGQFSSDGREGSEALLAVCTIGEARLQARGLQPRWSGPPRPLRGRAGAEARPTERDGGGRGRPAPPRGKAAGAEARATAAPPCEYQAR